MADFADRPGSELELTIDGEVVPHREVLAERELRVRAGARENPNGGEGLELNLFAEAERLAARAASPSTRRQYAAIYRSFGDWLRGGLGRPPTVADLDGDVIAAYARHLEIAGGRGGRPAAAATRRVYLSMIRALARELGRDDVAARVRVPRHKAGPPETLTETEYQNLLRVPDRRSQAGKRDYALLRVLGDCGLRSAELRGLIARDLRRPRVNGRHRRLYGRGKGGSEREVPVPEATLTAFEAWLTVHPLARGRGGLRDEDPVFVRLGRYPGAERPEPLSAQAVHKLVRRCALAAGVPERLAHPHPHALRTYWATSLLEDGVAIHRVSNRLGHADLRTTSATPPSNPIRLTMSPTFSTGDIRRHDARTANGQGRHLRDRGALPTRSTTLPRDRLRSRAPWRPYSRPRLGAAGVEEGESGLTTRSSAITTATPAPRRPHRRS